MRRLSGLSSRSTVTKPAKWAVSGWVDSSHVSEYNQIRFLMSRILVLFSNKQDRAEKLPMHPVGVLEFGNEGPANVHI